MCKVALKCTYKKFVRSYLCPDGAYLPSRGEDKVLPIPLHSVTKCMIQGGYNRVLLFF